MSIKPKCDAYHRQLVKGLAETGRNGTFTWPSGHDFWHTFSQSKQQLVPKQEDLTEPFVTQESSPIHRVDGVLTCVC